MGKNKTHFRRTENDGSVCGAGESFDEIEWVTCRNCIRIMTRERDGGKCVDCQFPTTTAYRYLTMGHVVAMANGGQWRYNNIVTQCVEHNLKLGSRTWREGWDK